MTLNRCLACGEGAVEERCEPFEFNHNGRRVAIDDIRMVCRDCGNITYAGPQISQHELAVAAAIRKADGLLSPDEMRIIRLKYSLKQSDMEQILSTGPKTWTRWERGKITHSKATDKLIRQMAERPDLVRDLMRDANVDNPDAIKIIAQFEEDAKRIASLLFKAELGDKPSEELSRFADRVAEKAFETVRDARRLAVSGVEAA